MTQPPPPDPPAPPAAADSPDARPARRWLRGAAVAIGALAAALGLAFAVVYLTADVPSAAALARVEPTVVLDAEGTPVGTLDPTAVHRNVSRSELPPHVWQAVLAAEDRSFFDHGGFSVSAILRAAWANVTSGEVVQGGSTIPQQYVGLRLVDGTGLVGKFREAATAARLDGELSKDEVLEAYLNAVPFGRGARGIESAARTYFGVSAGELDVNQAATLAGMIAAPTAYDLERHPAGAEARRDYVLAGMAAEGWLPGDRAEALQAAPLPAVTTEPVVDLGPNAYFLDAVREAVPALLGEERDPYAGLVVHTTLDRRAQELAVAALDEELGDRPHAGAVVTIDAGTGAVRALVGGRDYAQQQFNVATAGRRQAGSAFKPFALTALVADGGSPDSRVDAPRTVEVPDAGDDTAEVGNYTRRGYGEVTVREATRRSINTAYVNLAAELGVDTVLGTARDLGVTSELPEVPTTVLGVGGVSPLEMAAAYATLAAGGVRRPVHLVTRVEFVDGEVRYEHEPADERVLDPAEAAVVTDVLTEVVDAGTGTAAALDRPVAGKTGTTDEHRDAWFVGYTPRWATAVWVGNLDNTPMDGVTGGSLPARVWSRYMAGLVSGTPVEAFPDPDDLDLDLEVRDLDGFDDERERPDDPVRSAPPPEPEPEPEPEPSTRTPSPEPTEAPPPSPPGGPSPGPSPGPSDPTEEPTEPPTDEPTDEPSPDGDAAGESSPEPTADPSPDGTTSPGSAGG